MYGNGRFILYGGINSFTQVSQRIDLLTDIPCGLRSHIGKYVFDRRKILHRAFERQHIPGIDGSKTDLGYQSFYIIDAAEILSQLIPFDRICRAFTDYVQTVFYILDIDKRLFDKASKQPSAHGGSCRIQYAEQRSDLQLISHGFRKLQISPGRGIYQHIFTGHVRVQMRKLYKVVLLGFIQIIKQCPGSADTDVKVRDTHSDKA